MDPPYSNIFRIDFYYVLPDIIEKDKCILSVLDPNWICLWDLYFLISNHYINYIVIISRITISADVGGKFSSTTEEV